MIQVIYGPEYLLIWQGQIEVAVGKKDRISRTEDVTVSCDQRPQHS